MKRFVTAIVAISACFAAARAAGYDEFARGISAHIRDDHDTAIAALTAALNSGELVPAYVAATYRIRSSDFLEKGRCDKAATDLKVYAALRPDDSLLPLRRLEIDVCLGDTAGVQKDFEAVERRNETRSGDKPDYSVPRFVGDLQWRYGRFAEAAASYELAFSRAEKNSETKWYILLWYALSADRAGKLDQAKLSAGLTDFDITKWPGPLFELYLGKKSAAVAHNELGNVKADAMAGQQCEADFYVAEWYLARNNMAAALPLLQSAAAGCPKTFAEYAPAKTELRRQTPSPAKE